LEAEKVTVRQTPWAFVRAPKTGAESSSQSLPLRGDHRLRAHNSVSAMRGMDTSRNQGFARKRFIKPNDQ